jgi:hypothetical protein
MSARTRAIEGIIAEREGDAIVLEEAYAEGRVFTPGELWAYASRDLERVRFLFWQGELPGWELYDAQKRVKETREMMKAKTIKEGRRWPGWM